MNGDAKSALRRTMRAALRALPADRRAADAMAVAEVIASLPELVSVRCLMCFASAPIEIDTAPVIAWWLGRGGALILPRVEGDALCLYTIADPAADLTTGFRGIPEPNPARCSPAEPATVGVVLLPGLAFARNGGRLGQGGGHYDRLLPCLPPAALRIALAYDLQMVHDSDLPLEPHDQRIDLIATPSGLIRCPTRPH